MNNTMRTTTNVAIDLLPNYTTKIVRGYETYIPPEGKTIRIGSLPWVLHPMQGICVADTNMLIPKNPGGPTQSLAYPTRTLVDPTQATSRASGI